MNLKRTLIIYYSSEHKNTYKIAKEIGMTLNADIKEVSEVNVNNLNKYDIIGFGSGIYNSRSHPSLLKLIDSLKNVKDKKAFVFSTALITYKTINKPLITKLESKGFKVIDDFYCKGFMDHKFVKYLGGFNKDRPNLKDLEDAKKFALKLKDFLNNPYKFNK
ncbi:MAG: flavodoxin domain-containing protein [Candidatus Nanoarchaeia archaeon]|nr:flavodoxin domain-containing protein [Candidatus Nanoarchaeia archaeon]